MVKPARILVAGADLGGVHAAREFLMTQPSRIDVLGVVDDSDSLQGATIEGVEVIGKTMDIPQLVKNLDIDDVIIAMPSVARVIIQRIQAICNQAAVGSKVIPGAYDILTGLAKPRALREVRFEDLQKRQPVVMDLDSITNVFILKSG